MSQEITEPQIEDARTAVNRRQVLTNEQWIVADKALAVAAATVREWETPRKVLRDEFAMSVSAGLVSGGFFALLLQQELAKGLSMDAAAAEACKGSAGVAYKFATAMLEARKF